MGKLIAVSAAGVTSAFVIAYELWSRCTAEGRFCSRHVASELRHYQGGS